MSDFICFCVPNASTQFIFQRERDNKKLEQNISKNKYLPFSLCYTFSCTLNSFLGILVELSIYWPRYASECHMEKDKMAGKKLIHLCAKLSNVMKMLCVFSGP